MGLQFNICLSETMLKRLVPSDDILKGIKMLNFHFLANLNTFHWDYLVVSLKQSSRKS